MAVEALAALSVAGAVFQFIDFASKLVSKGNSFHKSTDGVLQENGELLAVAVRMRQLSSDIVKTADSLDIVEDQEASVHSKQLSPTGKALKEVAHVCQGIGRELIDALDRLKISGRRTRWKSFRMALKSVWGKEVIEKLLGRLRLAREDFVIHLLVMLK